MVKALLSPIVTIAALGMIESLLCGASASRMKGEEFNADQELIAQGVGNILLPLFGGVPATAAIARTSVAVKSGQQTRLTSVFHSVFLLASMFLLGGVMARLPLSALAGVLMVTAWRMNDWAGIRYIFRRRFKSGISQFLLTMIATVVFDLTVAILLGVIYSAILYMAKSSQIRVSFSAIDANKLRAIDGKPPILESAGGVCDRRAVFRCGGQFQSPHGGNAFLRPCDPLAARHAERGRVRRAGNARAVRKSARAGQDRGLLRHERGRPALF